MFEWWRSVLSVGRALVDSVLPPRCFSCGLLVTSQGELCSHCWTGLNFISKPQCHCCGFPFEFASAVTGQLCGACLESEPLYEKARAVFRYDDASKKLILALKYFDKLDGAEHFGRLMWRTIEPFAGKDDIVIPVPLHPKRLFQRRFNQAALLAKAIRKYSGLEMQLLNLIRQKPTVSQGGLSRNKRLKNVRGAFSVKNSQQLEGRSVILVDDVQTTGATVNECVRVLLKAGVQSVIVISLARVAR